MLTAMLIYMKRFLKKPSFAAALVLMPVTAIVFMLCFKASPTGIRVGLAGSGENTMEVQNILLSKKLNTTFIKYEDTEKMKTDILTGDLECGYIFDRDFEAAFDDGGFRRTIGCVKSSSTVLDRVINEAVTEAAAEVYCRKAAVQKVNDLGLNYDAEKLYDSIIKGGDVFRPEYVTVNGESRNLAVSPNHKGRDKIFRCVLAVYIMLGTLLGAVIIAGDRKRGIYRWNCTGVLSAAVIMSAAAEITFGAISGFQLQNLLYALLYCLAVWGFASVAMSFGSQGLILGMLPVLVIGSFALAPVFFDLGSLMPAVRGIGFVFPPRWYFLIYEKNGILMLAGIAVLVNLLSFRLGLCQRLRK